ncbi:MAG: DUF2073 domain-containing protein [archaeon]
MLTFQFMRYSQIADLGTEERIKMVLSLVKQGKILVLEGRLSVEEEKSLLQRNMEQVDEKFTGIEFEVVHPEEKSNSFQKQMRKLLARILLGTRDGFTIIGPANIIKEIRKDPEKIELFTKDVKVKSKKKKR